MTSVPLTDAKTRLNELVDEAVRTHERVTITKHGRPAVIMMAVEDLAEMEETIFWQSQPGLREDVETGRAEFGRGETLDEAAVRRRHGVGQPRE